ncbi:MAG: SusC/RagA family TonB-linked outer membrane protein [Polaribacter sp.]
MKKGTITLLLLLFSVAFFGQDINVKGVVKDAATGETLPGVSVVVKGTSVGTETDFDGMYQLKNVKKGSTLIFSYLGMQTKEVVANKEVINVTLDESAQQLDEIVVVGYGTQRKKEVTGAVSLISSETLEEIKPVRVEQALQGQVAGVNITSTSGSPGAGLSIRIRGITTNGDNNPLILVDGNRIGDLSTINPSDIASINILKDATAGIYGVQGANGVILITTKTGRKNSGIKHTINTYMGFQQTTREIPVLNATEYALLANEAYAANGESLPFPNVSGYGQGTNWQQNAFETAPISSIDYTLNKGTEKSTLSFGLSVLDQDGIVGGDKSNFNRRVARLNYTYDITEKLKLTTSTIFTNSNKKSLIENTLGSVLFNALNMPPTIPVRDANGDFSLPPAIGTGIEVANPLAQVDNTFNIATVNKIAGAYRLSYAVNDNLSAEARYQFNYADVFSKSVRPEGFFGQGSVFNVTAAQANVQEVGQIYRDFTFNALLRYENTFGEDHYLQAMLGTEVFRTQGYNLSNLQLFGITERDLWSVSTTPGSVDNLALSNQPQRFFDSRLLSYFARVQYKFKDRYLLSGVIRRDGSSNFGPKNKFGFFPSVSAGWIVSEENFMSDVKFVDNLKLRGSWGIIGNDKIPSFGFVSLLTGEGTYVFNNQLQYGIALGAISNPEIRWEKNINFNGGIDATLFDRKLNITADYFYKKTEDLLVNPQVSGILGVAGPGAAGPVVNAGTVENRGVEFSIGYSDEISDDFKFNLNYNVTRLDNEVLFVGNSTGVLEGGSFGIGQDPPSRMEAGFPIGYFYGYQTDGIFQTQAEINSSPSLANTAPGDIKFVDVNGDGVIDSDDKTYIGDPIADVTMGFNMSFNYKNWDFNAYAFASIGNEIVRNYERNLPLTNRPSYFLDRWTGPGTSNTFPRVTTGATNNILFSDFYVEDGSFVRLQSVQLGYTLNESLVQKINFDSIRFYVSASNLFTLTKYRGYDPTTSSGAPIGGGIDQGFYPNPKTFLLGANINF